MDADKITIEDLEVVTPGYQVPPAREILRFKLKEVMKAMEWTRTYFQFETEVERIAWVQSTRRATLRIRYYGFFEKVGK